MTYELGQKTIYTLDSLTGNTLSVRQVVVQVDAKENQEMWAFVGVSMP